MPFFRGKWVSRIKQVVIVLFGIIGPLLIPPIHIYVLWYFWEDYNWYVDKYQCTCSCWDTVFKGTYEQFIGRYKHVYFNATENSCKIWIITVISVISLYESMCYLTKLLFSNKLRYTMLLLFLTSIFSHYYSWWSYFNYLNDDYYDQWSHQMFFTITELISTILVLYLANKHNEFSNKKAYTIISIAFIHIFTSSKDQFVWNVIAGYGFSYQVIRDLCFMVSDLLSMIIPFLLLVNRQKEIPLYCEKDVSWSEKIIFSDFIYLLSIIILGVYSTSLL